MPSDFGRDLLTMRLGCDAQRYLELNNPNLNQECIDIVFIIVNKHCIFHFQKGHNNAAIIHQYVGPETVYLKNPQLFTSYRLGSISSLHRQ